MKNLIKSLTLVALFVSYCTPSWAQTPSTEGQDFWVTFLQAQTSSPELILTISARDSCTITIENPNVPGFQTITRKVGNNTSTSITINNRAACYSMDATQLTYTALHVTSTKDISLFAANYITKTFDAANILPTASLLDNYIIQTFPPYDHGGDNESRGSHFAIVAVEDGETTIDYTLTANASVPGKSATEQSVKLKQGQVCYVWTGKGVGDAADLSGSTVKARNGKKIAVFQGCPHTNIPNGVRDRDHLFSQAMPTAYWGSEFGITSSRQHRRDIIAVMAINDGTEVYIRNKDGEPELKHTFDFSKDKKHYWTFEIGEYEAYCTDDKNDLYGPLMEPLIVDSSCYLTTSCPAGIHLFMVSNRYDNESPNGSNICDPAMLWISPIEQVIKEINFSTYNKGTEHHYLNIVTTSANVSQMQLDSNYISQEFHPLMGNSDYSFARMEIDTGTHNLQGKLGFLAHVYGYGVNESYAYSCGSSTVQRSISFNDEPLEIGEMSDKKFCVGDTLKMKLNIGNNDYQSITWDFDDGITYSPDITASNNEKRQAVYVYKTPGWYDLKIYAMYKNICTGEQFTDTLDVGFRVTRPDTIFHYGDTCVMRENYNGELAFGDTTKYDCDSVVANYYTVHFKDSISIDTTATDVLVLHGITYTTSTNNVRWVGTNKSNCDSICMYNVHIIKCLDLQIQNDSLNQHTCHGVKYDLPLSYCRDGLAGDVYLKMNNKQKKLGDFYNLRTITEDIPEEPNIKATLALPFDDLKPGKYTAQVIVRDSNCHEFLPSPMLDIAVYYHPDSIMKLKFDNVLAIYNKANNGGYDFQTFEWYHNGELIPDAHEAVYRTEQPFTPGDTYYLWITDNRGNRLPSCEFTIPGEPATSDEPAEAPARKVLVNRRMCIIKEGRIYNIFGQRIQ